MQTKTIGLLLCSFFLVICLATCGHREKSATNFSGKQARPGQSQSVNKPDSAQLAQNFANLLPEDSSINALLDFYKQRDFRFLWWDKDDPTPAGRSLLNLLKNSESYGIPSHYIPRSLIDASLSSTSVTQREVRLTVLFLQQIEKFRIGVIDPQRHDKLDWYVEQKNSVRPFQLLNAISTSDSEREILNRLELHPSYFALRAALLRYQRIQKEGGWPMIQLDDSVKLLVKGDTGRTVRQLITRLEMSGDLSASNQSHQFDGSVETALRAFQNRHGLIPDGVVGGNTLKALNTPVEVLIRKIMLNLERWRWIPRNLMRSNYLFVNVPDYRLSIYENGTRKEDMRIVVGKDSANTTLFNDVIQFMVVNPYWRIPVSIAQEDILPKLVEDRTYLEENHMEVGINWEFDRVDADTINWKMVDKDQFPYTLRRKPGNGNPLGKIKFIFPNRVAIYLHDTPVDEYFDAQERDFSHGCIRLEKPMILAKHLLNNNADTSFEEVQALISQDRRKEIPINKPIPVFIVYFTSWVDEEGSVHFREDVYQHDKTLAALLFEKEETLPE